MCAHDTGKSNQTQPEFCRNANEDASQYLRKTGQSENTTKQQHNATDTPSRLTVCTMEYFKIYLILISFFRGTQKKVFCRMSELLFFHTMKVEDL